MKINENGRDLKVPYQRFIAYPSVMCDYMKTGFKKFCNSLRSLRGFVVSWFRGFVVFLRVLFSVLH